MSDPQFVHGEYLGLLTFLTNEFLVHWTSNSVTPREIFSFLGWRIIVSPYLFAAHAICQFINFYNVLDCRSYKLLFMPALTDS